MSRGLDEGKRRGIDSVGKRLPSHGGQGHTSASQQQPRERERVCTLVLPLRFVENLFFLEFLSFLQLTGLHFLLEFFEATIRQTFQAILTMLSV